MKRLVIYIHGKGGNAEEADHYRPIFADSDVMALTINFKIPPLRYKENAKEGFTL